MTTRMSTDGQTQSIPRVSTMVMLAVPAATIAAPRTEVDAPEPEADNAVPVPAPETATPGREPAVAGEEPVESIYEAAMARLNTWHDGWAAATAELREARTDSAPGEAAA